MDDSIDDFDDNTGDDDDDDRVDLDLSDCLVCGDAYLRLQLNSGKLPPQPLHCFHTCDLRLNLFHT